MKHFLLVLTTTLLFIGCKKEQPSIPSSPDIPSNPPPTTITLPTITTAAATAITTTSAVVGGTITNNGGATITEKGICYSTTNTNPSITDIKLTSKSNANAFADTLKNLSQNTFYYARAYAINSKGVAYGQRMEFKTEAVPPVPSTIKDYDGNLYNVIKIGDQYWTKENFRGEHYNDGEEIKSGGTWNTWKVGAVEWYVFWYDCSKKHPEYGGYYNWYAVNTGKLAPKGWHVATLADLNKLKATLTPGLEGQEMKDISWRSDKDKMILEANRNKSGFSALARDFYNGGWCSTSRPIALMDEAYFWLADEKDANKAYFFSLWALNSVLNVSSYDKEYGYSIRFVKD